MKVDGVFFSLPLCLELDLKPQVRLDSTKNNKVAGTAVPVVIVSILIVFTPAQGIFSREQ